MYGTLLIHDWVKVSTLRAGRGVWVTILELAGQCGLVKVGDHRRENEYGTVFPRYSRGIRSGDVRD